MKGSRPEQAVLSRETDMSKTDATRSVIEDMVDGLNDHRITDIGEFFADGFRWIGNTGCGTPGPHRLGRAIIECHDVDRSPLQRFGDRTSGHAQPHEHRVSHQSTSPEIERKSA